MATLRTELRNEELKSLRTLSATQRQAAAVISPEHREKLVGYGYAALFADTLKITPVGQAKLVYETTRANWFPAPSQPADVRPAAPPATPVRRMELLR